MKILIITLLTGISISPLAFAHPEVPGVINISKAIELGVHRIERLVTLKKIDPVFQSQLYSMRAERTTDGGATYKIYGLISPDSNNQSSTIDMLSDKQGKMTPSPVTQMFPPANPVTWPQVDSLTLIENALHFVLEGWVQHPEVEAYNLGLMTITLRPSTDAAGQMIAEAAVTSDDDPRTLYIRLKVDGSFLSYELR